MALETTEKDTSIAFEKLAITSNGGYDCKTPTTIFSHFKSKIFAAIDEIREKNRRNLLTYNEVSNTDKNLVETVIAELTKQNMIINKKICH